MINYGRSSVVLLTIYNFRGVFAVCMPCLQVFEKSHFSIEKEVSGNLKNHIWKTRFCLNGNIHCQNVHTQMGFIEDREGFYNKGYSSPCIRYPQRTRLTHGAKCLLLLFHDLLNITPIWGGDLETLTPLEVPHLPLVGGWRRSNIVPSHYAIEVNSYAFMPVIDKDHFYSTTAGQVKVSCILKPPVLWVWVVIAIASVLMSMLLVFNWNKNSRVKISKVSEMWFALCSIILEESGSSVRSLCEVVSLLQLFLVSLWCGFILAFVRRL